MQLDIGCGLRKRPGFLGVDRGPYDGVDVVHNLETLPWPFENDCAEAIVLDNVIEHLPDTVGTFNELHRITRRDGVVEMIYPYYRSFGAYGDPTHVRFFNEFMIDYFLRPGTTRRRENAYAFYTDKYWRIVSRRLITYPFLSWVPDGVLRGVSRHLALDVVHGVHLRITPDK